VIYIEVLKYIEESMERFVVKKGDRIYSEFIDLFNFSSSLEI